MAVPGDAEPLAQPASDVWRDCEDALLLLVATKLRVGVFRRQWAVRGIGAADAAALRRDVVAILDRALAGHTAAVAEAVTEAWNVGAQQAWREETRLPGYARRAPVPGYVTPDAPTTVGPEVSLLPRPVPVGPPPPPAVRVPEYVPPTVDRLPIPDPTPAPKPTPAPRPALRPRVSTPAVDPVSTTVDTAARAVSTAPERAVEQAVHDSGEVMRRAVQAVPRQVDQAVRDIVRDVSQTVIDTPIARRRVLADAVDRLARTGMTEVVDTAGRRRGLQGYADTAIRTTVADAYADAAHDTWQEQGYAFVRVSAAHGTCRVCHPYEGKILSLPGADLRQLAGTGVPYAGTLADARAAGLFHPNCRHATSLFIPGVHETPPQHGARWDRAAYEARQRQRALERDIRDAKRRVAAARETGDPTVTARAQALLRARQARMRAHVQAHPGDLKRRYDRERALGPS